MLMEMCLWRITHASDSDVMKELQASVNPLAHNSILAVDVYIQALNIVLEMDSRE